MKKFLSIIAATAVCLGVILGEAGCAGGWQKVESTLGTPQQVEQDVYNLASVAKSHLSEKGIANVHKFVVYLQQASDLDITTLTNMIPSTGNVNADAAISAAVVYVKSAISKWGSHNPTTLAYAHAVANGFARAGL